LISPQEVRDFMKQHQYL